MVKKGQREGEAVGLMFKWLIAEASLGRDSHVAKGTVASGRNDHTGSLLDILGRGKSRLELLHFRVCHLAW